MTNQSTDDEDMPTEIDFSGGVRGKFHHAGARVNLPIYLDAEVQTHLAAIAKKKGMQISELANDLLKREIEIIETVK
jgi:hypothetical protein